MLDLVKLSDLFASTSTIATHNETSSSCAMHGVALFELARRNVPKVIDNDDFTEASLLSVRSR